MHNALVSRIGLAPNLGLFVSVCLVKYCGGSDGDGHLKKALPSADAQIEAVSSISGPKTPKLKTHVLSSVVFIYEMHVNRLKTVVVH